MKNVNRNIYIKITELYSFIKSFLAILFQSSLISNDLKEDLLNIY